MHKINKLRATNSGIAGSKYHRFSGILGSNYLERLRRMTAAPVACNLRSELQVGRLFESVTSKWYLGASCEPLGGLLVPLGGLLGASWGPLWGLLGASWWSLGPFVPSCGPLGGILA